MNTIYAYWDAEQIKYVLDAVAMLTSMQDYSDLLTIFGIVGLFAVVIMGMAKARGEQAAQYLIFAGLWTGVLFVPKQDVQIIDIAGGGGTYTVSNVPIGLAFFASAESHIGYWLTKSMETVFALPGTISFEKTGFMFASRGIIERQQRMRFSDPNLVSSLSNLTKDCIYPELNNNSVLFEQVMKSSDIWADLGPAMNPGLYTTVYNAASARYVIEPCSVAWDTLDFQINKNVEEKLLPKLGRILNPTAPASTVKFLVMAQMFDLNNFVFGVSRSAAETVKQAAMINLLADSTTFVPQMIGDTTSAQVAVASAQAAAAANSSYLTMSKISESSLPLIRNAIHIVILGLFPIVMLMIVVAGERGAQVLKTYVLALLWVNLWAPIYALMNFFSSWWMTKGAQAAVEGMDPISFASHQALMHSAISDQAIAGILVISVPVIAYMLTNISASSFTSAISGIMSPSTSAAQTAGGTVGVGNTSWGNVQMGNYSWNNQSANKWDTAGVVTQGAPISRSVGADGAMTSSYANGTSTIAEPMNQLRVGSSVASSQASVLTQQASEKRTAARAHTLQAGKAEEAILGMARSHASSLTFGAQSDSGARKGAGGQFEGSFGQNTSTTESSGSTAKYSTGSTAKELGVAGIKADLGGSADADARAGKPVGESSSDGGSGAAPVKKSASVAGKMKAGLGGSLDMKLAQEYQAGIAKEAQTGQRSDIQDNAQARQAFFNRLESDASFRESVLGQNAYTQATGANLSYRRSHLDQASAQEQQATELAQQAESIRQDSTAVSFDPLKAPYSTHGDGPSPVGLSHRVESAPAGEQTEALRGAVANLGHEQDPGLPAHYADGSPVVATSAGVADRAAEYRSDSAFEGSAVEAQHRSNMGAVQGSGRSLGANAPEANKNSGLVGVAGAYYQAGQDKFENAVAVHTGRHEQGEQKYRGEAGDENPLSMQAFGYNKLANTVDDMAFDDAVLSGRQALGGLSKDLPGAAPALEDYQEEIGYKPAEKR